MKQEWDDYGKWGWINSVKTNYTYNKQGDVKTERIERWGPQIRHTDYRKTYDPRKENWEEAVTYEFKYDENGNLVEKIDKHHLEISHKEVYKIENGKITTPLKVSVVTGNVFSTLDEIDGISEEFELLSFVGGGCGKMEQYPLPVGFGGPFIRVKKLNVQ